jgi:hypothetical protein
MSTLVIKFLSRAVAVFASSVLLFAMLASFAGATCFWLSPPPHSAMLPCHSSRRLPHPAHPESSSHDCCAIRQPAMLVAKVSSFRAPVIALRKEVSVLPVHLPDEPLLLALNIPPSSSPPPLSSLRI